MAAFKSLWSVQEITPDDLHILDQRAEPQEVPSLAGTNDLVVLVVPEFQRSLKWSAKKRSAFYESVRDGRPFGIITIAELERDPGHVNTVRYRLIDGLQRLNAMRRLNVEFFKRYPIADADLNAVTSAAQTLGTDLTPEQVEKIFNKWRSEAQPKARGLVEALAATLDDAPSGTSDEWTGASDIIDDLVARLEAERSAFRRVKIPVQVIGRELHDDLASVFDQLNSGLKLNKYEQLAARLADFMVDLTKLGLPDKDRQELIRHANSRFKAALDADYRVETHAEDATSLPLYDYLHARSKWAESMSCFDATKELAFNVAALLFTGSLRSLDQGSGTLLAESFPSSGSGTVDVTVFDSAFQSSVNAVDTALDQYAGWKLGVSNLSNPLGALQAAAYVASHIALTHRAGKNLLVKRKAEGDDAVLRSGTTMSPTRRAEEISRNLKWWLLLDAMSQVFVGSAAYQNAVRRVWDGEFAPAEDLLAAPPLDRFEGPLRETFAAGLRVALTPEKRVPLTTPATALMRAAFANDRTHFVDGTIDHVYPLEWARSGGRLRYPLNYFGNIAFVGKADNSGRQHELFPTWLSALDLSAKPNLVANLTKVLLVDPTTLSADEAVDAERFTAFLQRRGKLIARAAFLSLDSALDQTSLQGMVDRAMESAVPETDIDDDDLLLVDEVPTD